jgi:RNA polymerase sigma factor (sigma-70 family)
VIYMTASGAAADAIACPSEESRSPGRSGLDEITISAELLRRPIGKVNPRGELDALRSLAGAASRNPVITLKCLARLAVQLCKAGTGGVSVIESGEDGQTFFRWQALAGELESFEGGTTPRDWSPCGECLRIGKPVLYSYPARYFTYFCEIDVPIVEGLVIPLDLSSSCAGTIWIVSHQEHRGFDAEHVRVMTSLGNFAAVALRQAACESASRLEHSAAFEREIVWAEYLRRIARRDQFALAALIEETQPFVFSTALRILSFRQDAEEVVGDVFERVWETANDYDGSRGKVGAWLSIMARSRAINRLRSRIRDDRSEAALCVHCTSASSPEGSAAAVEARTHLLTALTTLPPEQRRAIELAYFHDLTTLEIAKQLGHPPGSVKTRIRLGLMKLRRILAAVV